MKHLTKYLSIILTAAILLTGCQSQGVGAADEQTSEASGVTLSTTNDSAESSKIEQPESYEPDEIIEAKQHLGADEDIRFFVGVYLLYLRL